MKIPVIKKVVAERGPNNPYFALFHHQMVKDYFLHFHDFYEIEIVVSGRCIHHINGENIECGPNSAVFLTPLDLHSVTLLEQTEIINLNFEAAVVDSTLSEHLDKSLYAHHLNSTYVNLLFKEYNSGQNHSHTIQKMLLNCILAELFRHAENVIEQKPNNVAVDIARYIKLNYNTNITLTSLSNMFGYTPNYISSQFHKNMDKTVKQFLADVRLENAAKALLVSPDSVTDICFASGFTSLAHFLRSFKAKYHETPSDYRKKHSTKK